MTQPVRFSVDAEVLRRFRALVPLRERSRVIERLMREDSAQRESLRELEIEALARQVELDPALADLRRVSEDVDGVAGLELV
jgi:hypothetical protein